MPAMRRTVCDATQGIELQRWAGNVGREHRVAEGCYANSSHYTAQRSAYQDAECLWRRGGGSSTDTEVRMRESVWCHF